MPNFNNISEIIMGCQNNDNAAQECLFNKYYNTLFIICLRYASSKLDAQDLLQETFIKVFKNINQYSFKGSFEGWIKRICVNTALDYIKKNKSQIYEENTFDNFNDVNLQTQPNESIFETTEIEHDSFVVIEAMQHLTPAYRTTLNLYVFENLTHKQIAEKLGITIGSSKSNLAKARLKLQQILKTKLVNGAA